MLVNGKEFIEHPSGLFVANDGEVWLEGSGRGAYPSGHTTYGNTNNRGYKRVQYKGKSYSVHRLVAECFIPNPNNYPTIDHIDRNKENNNVENLRWATSSMQNYNKGYQKNNAKSKPVLQYTLEGELVKEWLSISECQRNGFHQGAVCACCRGKLNHYKRYIWRYKEEELEQI